MIDSYAIKESVTMAQICDKYGIEVRRGSFICCPFHSGDRNASLKIYPGNRGFNCFGCHATGSVIDFVMLYFDLDFVGAVKKINDDFSLGLAVDSEDEDEYRSVMERVKLRQERENQRKAQIAKAKSEYDIALAKYAYWDKVCIATAPDVNGKTVRNDYAYAIKRLPVAKYELDCAEMRLHSLEQRR